MNPNVYFLVGEKGTGKTAYATYLSNNEYKQHKVSIFNVRQTEYQKFLELKRLGHLPLSQYTEVWRTILLMIAGTSIIHHSGKPDFLQRFSNLNAVKKAIDEFYENAFSPEIVKMLTFVESGEVAAKLIAKHTGLSANVGATTASKKEDSNTTFQTNLLKIRQGFEKAVDGAKLDQNTLIFIDGIDVRPGDISYVDYFECVRGLIEAVWVINNDFLANVKGSKGRVRIVLLVRPDIFIRAGLHNLNTKLRDNSAFLDWGTTYKDYRTSLLFKVADRLLAAQQEAPPETRGDAWDYYFPFFAENVKHERVSGEREANSFISFLRFSYYRPRDISAMIATIKNFVVRKRGFAHYVTVEDFNDPAFRDAHAEYLLGEIRDQLLFYYSKEEYELFLQFFPHLLGKRKFSYDEYVAAFNEFIRECSDTGRKLPQFFENANVFLQFLYEQNVICYKELDAEDRSDAERFIRWCFRERTLANMEPKVRYGVDYEIFYGLSKALNVGKLIRTRKLKNTRVLGTIIALTVEKGYGFIRGGQNQDEFYFKLADFTSTKGSAPRLTQKVSFEVYTRHGQPRARAVRPAARTKK